ncbi:molybdopterin-dependent oxidoreductase [uncultured Clostridium sp.]|uniref:molybdopterin-dependent oxidoreductase n=1 Tax=uncultured Clostridium sp. TaxID=59620 RepID=UPI002617DFA0|nr:molybdopterin-dependent oxidoreductase [uncultured Clostridium sp.]
MEKIYSSGCTLDCFDCCKFNVIKNENNEIEIKGDKNHPFTKGIICKKGMIHKNILNHEKRIFTPLLKKEGKWIEISFDEAINIVVENLKKYKNEEVLYYEQYGNGGLLKSIGEVFFNFYGGCNRATGGPCWSAGIKAQKYDYGTVLSHSLSDMKNSKKIFVWGKNPANTTIHTMMAILEAKKRGSKVILIDPIKTETAKFVDEYISINPKGDYYLALSMGKIILERGLEDKEFIENYTDNFNEYKTLLEELDLNYLAQKVGLIVEDIEKLTEEYLDGPSSILLGYGMQKYENGGKAVRAIDALCGISGFIGVKGGGVNYANKLYGDILNLDPFNSESFGENIEFETNDLAKVLSEGKIKFAVITKSNLLNQLADVKRLKEGLGKVDFKVCFDLFMTDTAEEADLFIPTTGTLESEDLLFSSMTNPYIIYKEQVLEPKEKLMDEYYFFREVAKRLNIKDYPAVSKKEYLKEVIKPLGVTLEEVRDGYITREIKVPWEDRKFKTKSGKFQIGSFKVEEKEEEKGYRLITTHTKDSLFSQHFLDIEEISEFYINKREAEGLNIKEGEILLLKSKNGEIKSKCKINDGVKDNLVLMHVGWWKRSGNPNFLTHSVSSDIGGQIAYNETRIFIEKI